MIKIKKSIFETFEGYSRKKILFVLETFKSNKSSITLFVRQFGRKLDGVGARCDLDFSEKEQLDQLLVCFLNRLQYVSLMLEIGNSYETIQNDFKTKNILKIESMGATFCNVSKKDYHFRYKNLSIIRKELYATDEQILDALEKFDSNIKIAFKYSLGIKCQKLDLEEILAILKIDKKTYEFYMKEVDLHLADYVHLVKSEKKIKPQVRRKTTEITSSLPIHEEKKRKSIKQSLRKKNSFYGDFYTLEMSKEEKKVINDKVDLAIEYQKRFSIKGYEAFRKIYDENNCFIGNEISANVRGNFYYFRISIKKLVEEHNIEELQKLIENSCQKKRKTSKMKTSFYEYFYTLDMSKEEKKVISDKVDLAIEYQKRFSIQGYEAFRKAYDENNCLIGNVLFTNNEKGNFGNFRIAIEKLVEKYSAEELQKLLESSKSRQIIQKIRKRKTSFYEYFYPSEMSEEEKKVISDKVDLAIEYQKYFSIQGYEAFRKAYDENNCLIGNVLFTNNEKGNFGNFRIAIEKLVEKYSTEELQNLCEEKMNDQVAHLRRHRAFLVQEKMSHYKMQVFNYFNHLYGKFIDNIALQI